MKKLTLFAMLLAAILPLSATRHKFQTVEGDPLHTQMYTLPNGLKIFMTVNKDEPRIQTYIAVRVGGKNDPAETTGLAHYFEHLMFKGTEKFGTSDYAAEKPMLDKIEALFEKYRHTTDSVARRKIYKQIDSVSYEASKIAIPNEYDKLMSAIGAKGTNAYTSYDVTCYVEDIPSNQIENWAKIQADRFENPVIRGFHTELETIYEEKNMSLTKDNRKVYEKLLASLFPSHPYGRQTVLGTQEHLKNPSITNVKNYHKQWYVPNNMAICLSGDFDPDNMVDIIEKYFGKLKPNTNLKRPVLPNEKPISTPETVEVLGPEAENITLAWRLPEAANADMTGLEVLDRIVNNGSTGILDLNVSLPQRVLGAGAYVMSMADGSAYVMSGRPKADQSLDDVRTILLEQIDKLRKGEFSEELVEATKANFKLELQTMMQSNNSRADMYVDAFVNGIDWADQVAEIKALENVTKDDIVRLANKYLGPENYIAINKKQGKDPNELKIGKPELTPIVMNREKSSPFLLEIQNSSVDPIEPVFVDFDRDLTTLHAKQNVPVLYVPNKTNDLFRLIYVYDTGYYNDPALEFAPELIDLCGTPDMTPEDIRNEFYKLACRFYYSVGGERSYAVISGLSENMEKAAALYEKLIDNAQISPEAYSAWVDRVEKARNDAKHNQSANFSHLQRYVMYGPENPATKTLSVDALRKTNPAEFLAALRKLNDYEQTVIYWGNDPANKVLATVNDTHPLDKTLVPTPKSEKYPLLQTRGLTFFVAPYEAKQLYLVGYSNDGSTFDISQEPIRKLYNEYFGGSMNSVVFQEMRESRSLAYYAWAGMSSPSKKDRPYTYVGTIATQNDKLIDALLAFNEIVNQMPQSDAAYDLAKQALEARLRTNRMLNDDIAFYYLQLKDQGYDHDPAKDLFEYLPKATFDQLNDYQRRNVAGRNYRVGILAKPENIDINMLENAGEVIILTQEDIFGY